MHISNIEIYDTKIIIIYWLGNNIAIYVHLNRLLAL